MFNYTLSNEEFTDIATVTIEIVCDNLIENPGEEGVGPPLDANPDDMTGIDRPTGSDEVGPPGDANPDDMTGIDRPTGSDEVGPPSDANPDDMTGIDRPTGSNEVGPPGDANPDDMTGVERPLKLEDDFAEGNMNEALYIPVLANDTITGGELLSIFTFTFVNFFNSCHPILKSVILM